MSGDFRINERHRIQIVHIGQERNPVIVLDDLLANPQDMVDYASTALAFRTPPNWYPGLRAEPLPQAYIVDALRALHKNIAEVFGLPAKGRVSTNTYFGLATLSQELLSPPQRLPHFDTTNPRQVALLHYLADSRHGGTSFYRHRETGYESIGEVRSGDYFACLNKQIAQGGPRPARYMSGDDDLYEEIARFDAGFNRALIYRGMVLHSANVNPQLGLRADPRQGRLTANTFVTYG